MKRYKVYIIGTRGFPNVQGGVEAHCEEVYPFLQCQEFDVTLFARKRYILKSDRIDFWKGIRMKYLWSPKNRYFESIIHSFLCTLYALYHRPDIVHIHNIGPGVFIPLLKLFKIKTIITHHSRNYEHIKWNKIAQRFLRFSERISVKAAGRIITVSQVNQLKLTVDYGREVALIPNGMKLPHKGLQTDIGEKHNLIDQKFMLYVGRLSPEKGIDVLLKAFIKLTSGEEGESFSHWKLIIAGKADNIDSYDAYLKSIAQKSNNIIFTGYLETERIHDLYQLANLFVLPSYSEGCSLSLLEAVSHNLTCIVSDIPENKFFEPYKIVFFKVGDSQNLKEVLKEVLKKIAQPNGEKFLSSAQNLPDWHQVSELLIKEYKALLA